MTWAIHRDPFNGWRGVPGDVGRLFNAGLARPAQPTRLPRPAEAASGSWTPLVDIQEGEQSIILEADLPGLKPGDFKLSVENNVLTLSGERQRERPEKPEKEMKAERYERVERQYGRFTRTFTLPTTVDVEKATAEFRHGVLRVTLPKREELRARQIRIEVKSDAESATGAAGRATEVK
jgi:HSP20 family protein